MRVESSLRTKHERSEILFQGGTSHDYTPAFCPAPLNFPLSLESVPSHPFASRTCVCANSTIKCQKATADLLHSFGNTPSNRESAWPTGHHHQLVNEKKHSKKKHKILCRRKTSVDDSLFSSALNPQGMVFNTSLLRQDARETIAKEGVPSILSAPFLSTFFFSQENHGRALLEKTGGAAPLTLGSSPQWPSASPRTPDSAAGYPAPAPPAVR